MISEKTLVTLLCVFVVTLAGGSRNTYSQTDIPAITNPSADVILSFVQAGRIAKVHVVEGGSVKADELLVQLDDSVDQAQLAQIKAESEDTTQIEASLASLEQKKVDLKKLEKAAARDAATELEVEHAKLDVKIAELSLEVAKFQHEQAKRKYEEFKIRVENMRLKSPIDGRVEKINVETGESVNALAEVVRVVQIDPLWLDVHVPLEKASTLKNEKGAKIVFPGSEKVSAEGKIIYIAAVADAASDTLRVRIEVPNKSSRPAGEHVTVVFSNP